MSNANAAASASTLALLTIALAGVHPLAAQGVQGGEESGPRFSVEFGGGATIGSHTASAAGLETAVSLSYRADLGYALRPGTQLFAGYHHTAYGCETRYCQGVNPVLSAEHVVVGVEQGLGNRAWASIGLAYGSSKGAPSPLSEVPESAASTNPGGLASLGTTLGGGSFTVRPYISYLYYLSDDATGGSGHGTAITGGLGFRFGFGG